MRLGTVNHKKLLVVGKGAFKTLDEEFFNGLVGFGDKIRV